MLANADHCEKNRFDIVILGAGIAGCVTALLLRQCLPRVRVAIVDPSFEMPASADLAVEQRYAGDSLWSKAWRVSAVSLSVRALLVQLGLWQEVLSRCVCPYHDMVVADADGTGRFHVSAQEVGEPCLGYLLENEVLLQCLRRKCLADTELYCLAHYQFKTVEHFSGGVAVTCGPTSDELQPDDDVVLRCKLLIGADGRGSSLRAQMNVPVVRHDYRQSALVCQVETQYPHDWTAWQDFQDTGPLAFLPLSARVGFDPMDEMAWPMADCTERLCSIVWSLPTKNAARLCEPSAGPQLCAQLSALAPAALGRVERCSVASAFPLHGHLVERMQQEGVVLLGDAAHGYHPMAGQGLNVGLLDSAVLVDQLVQNAERLGDFAHQTGLRRYERQRRLQQRALFDLTTNLHRLYGRSEWWLRLGRNFGMRLFDELTPLKKVLAKRANGHLTDLPVRFRSNPEAMPF